jgi:hypothetical protein
MRRRKLLAAKVAGLAVLVAVGAFALWPRADRITRENFDRIQNGMSQAEVEAVLGPPGDYRSGPTYPDIAPQPKKGSPPIWWKANGAQIWVFFDPSGHVDDTFQHFTHPPEPNTLGNLIWRAKRQWRRWFPE